VLQECYKSVTRVLKECYKGVRSKLQVCYTSSLYLCVLCFDGKRVLQEWYKGVTRVLQECYEGVNHRLYLYILCPKLILHSSHKHLVVQGCYGGVTRISSYLLTSI
jgi:hypothetical protein